MTNPNYLPMLGVDKQTQHCGAMMAAQMVLSTNGIVKASGTLFEACVGQMNALGERDGLLELVDPLRHEHLLKRAHDRLSAGEDLAEPTPERESIRALLNNVKAIQAGATTRVTRDVGKAVAEVVDTATGHLREGVVRLFHAAPALVSAPLRAVRDALDGIEQPTASHQPLTKAKHLLQAMDNLEAFRTSLPRQKRPKIVELLLLSAQRSAADAVREAVKGQLIDPVNQARNQLRAFLAEIAQRGVEYRANLDVVRGILGQSTTEVEKRASTGRSSATITLPGPDEQEVIAAMRERFACADLGTLTMKVRERFETNLRAYAAAHLPAVNAEQAAVADLLHEIPPVKTAELWSQTMQSSLGNGHSLYERIAQRGVEKVAAELYDKAEHAIDIGDRDVDELNVHPTLAAAVSLPYAFKPTDVQVRDALKKALLDLNKGCFVAELPEDHPQVITMMRLEVGFPVGIDLSNYALLEFYAEAARHGHPMHLPSLSHGYSGNADQEYLRLAAFHAND